MLRHFHNATTIIPVDTLPADGKPPVVMYNGVVYLWGKVIELNGPDIFTIPTITSDIDNNDFEIMMRVKDLGTTATTYPNIFRMATAAAPNYGRLLLYTSPTTSFAILQWRIGDGSNSTGSVQLDFGKKLDTESTILIRKQAGILSAFLNGVSKGSVSVVGKTGNYVTESIISDQASDIRPLQVCCIKQSLNGTLIDHLPCDDGTGTAVRNIITPARAGSLNDPLAWGMGWRPIS